MATDVMLAPRHTAQRGLRRIITEGCSISRCLVGRLRSHGCAYPIGSSVLGTVIASSALRRDYCRAVPPRRAISPRMAARRAS